MNVPDPCPRCGSACEAVCGPVPDRWGVRCIECGLWADDREGTEAEAIAAWNRRAALPARGVRVRPLVWAGPRKLDEGGAAYDAHTTCGQYIATDTGWFLVGRSGWIVATSLDAAKAAAQADYEARILAALAPTDAPEEIGILRARVEDQTATIAALRRELAMGRAARTDAAQAREAAPTDAAQISDAGRDSRPAFSTPQPGEVLASSAPAPTDAAQEPFRIEDMTLADLMRDPLYEAATTPTPTTAQARSVEGIATAMGRALADAAQAREAALKEAAALLESMSRTVTHTDEVLGTQTAHSLVDPRKAAARILALIGETRT